MRWLVSSVGGAVIIAAVVVAAAFPRYGCPQGFQLRAVSGGAARVFDADSYCIEKPPFELGAGRPAAMVAADRLGLKLGIGIGGAVVGAGLVAFAMRRWMEDVSTLEDPDR